MSPLLPPLLLVVICVVTACNTDPPPPKPAPSVTECKDTRDGETFTVRSQDILESGIALDWPPGEWVKVRDTEGNIRTLWPHDARHLKCKTK